MATFVLPNDHKRTDKANLQGEFCSVPGYREQPEQCQYDEGPFWSSQGPFPDQLLMYSEIGEGFPRVLKCYRPLSRVLESLASLSAPYIVSTVATCCKVGGHQSKAQDL